MDKHINLWPNLMVSARNPLSLVALLILLILSVVLPHSGLATSNAPLFTLILVLCILGVFVVAIYGISAKNSGEKAEMDNALKDLAATLGQCIAEGSRPHIANLEISKERVEAYARLIMYVRGSGQASNSEFRARASSEIFLYAYTQGGCTKAELEESMQGIGG